jgi:hypothetical protein
MNSTNPLAAMVWKEMREGLKWAALLFVTMLAALVIMLGNHRGVGFYNLDYLHQGSPLMQDDFQAIIIIAGGVAGLLLGLVQTLPEKRLDKWAFLIHRPVARTTLLAGKVIAGLVLYFAALGVPLAAAWIWCATPGHVPAPFQPAMMLPAIADVLAGVMYYFAGVVIGMREARWYGSRILALGLPVAASFGVFIVPEFSYAALIIAVVSTILSVAAWGIFTAGGQYDPQPWVAKVALGLAILTGIVLAGGVGVAVLAEMMPRAASEYCYSDYILTQDGKILRRTQQGNGNRMTVTLTDLAGHPVTGYPTDASTFYSTVNMPPSASLWVGEERPGAFFIHSYRRPERFYVSLAASTQINGIMQWYYYVFDKDLGVGYDQRSRLVASYITPDGFQTGGAEPVTRFPGRPTESIYWENPLRMTFPAAQYELNVGDRVVKIRFQPPAGERLLAGATAVTTVPHNDKTGESASVPVFDAFATTSNIYVLAPDGKMILKTPFHRPPGDYGMVSVAQPEKSDRYFVWQYPQYNSASAWDRPQIVQEVSATGQELKRYELPRLVPPASPPGGAEAILIGATAPPVLVATMTVAAPVLTERRPLSEALSDPSVKSVLRAALVGGVLSALLTCLLAKQYAMNRAATMGWTIGNFLLGPAGILTMLSLRKWPTREVCPGCKRRRVVNRELCPRCAAPFLPPAADGTEIFAT